MATEAIKENIGEAAWSALSEPERVAKTTLYIGDCMQHLRNILLDAMAGNLLPNPNCNP